MNAASNVSQLPVSQLPPDRKYRGFLKTTWKAVRSSGLTVHLQNTPNPPLVHCLSSCDQAESSPQWYPRNKIRAPERDYETTYGAEYEIQDIHMCCRHHFIGCISNSGSDVC